MPLRRALGKGLTGFAGLSAGIENSLEGMFESGGTTDIGKTRIERQERDGMLPEFVSWHGGHLKAPRAPSNGRATRHQIEGNSRQFYAALESNTNVLTKVNGSVKWQRENKIEPNAGAIFPPRLAP
jgi:hypothetical protein